MIRSGLVSITFRPLSPRAIIDLVVEARQQAIEWGGDLHVPHGDLTQAKEVARMTADAGLQLGAYGSYYRVGESEAEGLTFDTVLETAVTLGAPAIRVWVGKRRLADMDAAYRETLYSESRRIVDLAAAAGRLVVSEYHAKTLTESDEAAQAYLAAIDHPNLRTLWQPHNAVDPAINTAGLRAVMDKVYYMHVFHWWPDRAHQMPLAEGEDAWRTYLQVLHEAGRDSWAMMEYVPDNSPESYLRDARVLQSWLDDINTPGE